MSKQKETNINAAVLSYMNKQNRPYSAIDILNNLHNEFGKTALIKALDQLVAEGSIRSKNYNKQIVYVADQQQFADINENEIKAMDTQILELGNQLKSSVDLCHTLEVELQKSNNSMTTDDAILKLNELNIECKHLCEKLISLKTNTNTIDPKEREYIISWRSNFGKEWRKRKRICDEMMNVVLEGYPKNKKAFVEEIGIETDENIGVNLFSV